MYVCNKKIDIMNFEVGHKISVFNNGTDNIDNLEPICRGCNLSMGIQDLNIIKINIIKRNDFYDLNIYLS